MQISAYGEKFQTIDLKKDGLKDLAFDLVTSIRFMDWQWNMASVFQAAIFYGRKAGNGGPAGIIGTATHRTRKRRFRMRWTISNGILQTIPM